MLNTININLKTDISTDRPTSLPITLMSQDKNNNKFILRFTNGGEPVALDDTYTVEVLTKFTKSGTSRLTTASVTPPPFKDNQDYATWEFDTEYITRYEEVRNYVYVRKSGNLVVSADANCFVFNVGLSEVDKDAGRVAETYDENYEKVLADYSGALDDRTTERLDEAVLDFNQRGDAEIADWRVSAEAELAGKADKVVLKNLVENGDFSNGVAGWSAPTFGKMRDENNQLIVTLTNLGGSSSYVGREVYKPANNVYYGYFEIKSLYPNLSRILIGDAWIGDVVTTPGVYTKVSGVHKPKIDSTDSHTLRYRHNTDSNYEIGDELYYRNMMLINLTEAFGAGNEPTKEEMDELIKVIGYIDGEYALNNKEMLGHLMKGIGDKANKKQEDWITPTLLNGWQSISGREVQYMKDEMGFVHFRGDLDPSTRTSSTVFTVPIGYRPSRSEYMNIGATTSFIGCHTTGVVVVTVTSTSWQSMTTLKYRAD